MRKPNGGGNSGARGRGPGTDIFPDPSPNLRRNFKRCPETAHEAGADESQEAPTGSLRRLRSVTRSLDGRRAPKDASELVKARSIGYRLGLISCRSSHLFHRQQYPLLGADTYQLDIQ